MSYFAHSENPLGLKHSLSDHLKKTAEIALGFGNDALTKTFKVAGFLHDFGKYQPEFQRYLVEGGRRGSVPHAAWGAGYARIHGMQEVSFAIDGHHKGLPNKSDWQADTEAFKRKKVQFFDSVVETFLKDTTILELELQVKPPSFEEILQREFFIRYLFSALVDADWIDTESHFNLEVSRARSTRTLPIDLLIGKLEEEFSRKSKKGEINRLRNDAREAVLQKAPLPTGFYSLNLPTGLGKTLISMAWALHHAKANGLKRILIVLPYINIIDQTAGILKDIFGEDVVLEHHSSFNESGTVLQNDEDNFDAIAKSKRLACENWDYPVIVTTTVQFFESLFSNKPSRCRKIHNIAQSVVIFDEVQSLPKENILPTLTMLKNVQSIMKTTFLFCTATQPAFKKRDNFNGIEEIRPLIDNPSEIFEKTQRVEYHFFQGLVPIEHADLLKAIRGIDRSVLMIFNTKKEPRLFWGSANKVFDCWQKIYHLSTAMCPDHRRRVIREIREDLTANRKILVCSTQLIEAGVDFDFPCVFREMAPLESLIQAAGRCNRDGKLNEKGKAYFFKLKEGGMPDRMYRACADYAQSLIQEDIGRLYRHDFFEEYYSQVVGLFVDPDKNKILAAQENFDFETVNDSYRLIKDASEGLYVWGYSQESQELFHTIENKPFLSRDDYRKMQVFTVPVYQNFLKENKEMCKMMPQGFWVWYGNYDNNTGISVEPILADRLIV